MICSLDVIFVSFSAHISSYLVWAWPLKQYLSQMFARKWCDSSKVFKLIIQHISYLSDSNDRAYRHGRLCRIWPCTCHTRTAVCKFHSDNVSSTLCNHSFFRSNHQRHRAIELELNCLEQSDINAWSSATSSIFPSFFLDSSALFISFLIINKFDFLSNSIYANCYTAAAFFKGEGRHVVVVCGV